MNMALQLLATVVLLYGLLEMGNRRLRGPFIAAVAEVLWIVVFVNNGAMWGGVLLSAILCGMQARNFLIWWRDGVTF